MKLKKLKFLYFLMEKLFCFVLVCDESHVDEWWRPSEDTISKNKVEKI